MARYKAVILAYLPNKKILFLIVFILLIFAGWFYFSDYKNKQVQYIADKEKSPLAVALDTTSRLDADADGDGLKDWEELLWKTDSGKADTDGDGTNDNEEITLNRNPLKAGPNDKISEKEDIVAQEKAVSESKQNTLTAAYAKQFLTEYLLLKQQKGELTEEDKNNLVEKFMGNIEPLVVADKYKLSDLKITQDNSKEAIKKYSEEMRKIFLENTTIPRNITESFNNLLELIKNNESEENKNIEIKKITVAAGLYDGVLNKLFAVPFVPADFKESHLDLLNGFNKLKFAAENMALLPTDSIKAMLGEKSYNQEIEKVYNALMEIKENFEQNGIYIF